MGAGNSPFTFTPDSVITDSGAYNAAYGGTDDSNPGRVEYLVLTEVGGDLHHAEFGWTKNEGIQRFDFDTAYQRFTPLPGGPVALVTTVGPSLNTTRVRIAKPLVSQSEAPFRLYTESDFYFTLVQVPDDLSFGTPAAGTVEWSAMSGLLNWAAGDLTTYGGQKVYFQQQAFFSLRESSGNIGLPATARLNPLPKTGQFPRLRLGYGSYLTSVEVPNDGAFSPAPVEGTVEWSASTGRLRFSPTDLASAPTSSVYYDGVLFGTRLRLPRETLGPVTAPSNPTICRPGADNVFRAILPGTWATGTANPTSTSVIVDGSANFTLNAKVGSVIEITSGPYAGTRRSVSKVLSSTSVQVLPPLPARVPFSYRIEKQVRQFATTTYVESFTLPFGLSGVVEVLTSTGQVRLSLLDQASYPTHTLELVSGDLPLERGLSLRLFRTPVDLEAASKDVADTVSHYTVPTSLLADPIQGAPFVLLPVPPLDDAAYPLSVEVGQGTGFFEGDLPRLDTSSPPSGLGYLLDFDQKRLTFAKRVSNTVQALGKGGAAKLPDTLIQPQNLTLEVNLGLGYQPLVLDSDAILEPNSGSLSFTSEIGREILSGVGSVSGTTLTASTLTGVQAGDNLVVNGLYVVSVTSVAVGSLVFAPALPLSGTVGFAVRRGKEVLLDRFFEELYLPDPKTKIERIRRLGPATNSPRHQVESGRTRVRLDGSFIDLTLVPTDGNFTSVPAGTVQVSASTGNLNYSTADLGKVSYSVLSLRRDIEYRISPELGVVQFVERLLAGDEALLTYVSALDSSVVEERGRFLIRKEVTSHPEITSTIPFNPQGRTVASTPTPSVFRGGRPLTDRQVFVSPDASTITFLGDAIPTPGGAYKVVDDLPHGSIVTPDERVYIDYYVYEAVGGENTVSVLQPPMLVAQVNLKEGSQTFTAPGNRVSSFPSGYALKVDANYVHIITSAVYDSGQDVTTVTLAGQPVQEDLQNPPLFISSGPVGAGYFATEVNAFESISRGSNKVRIPGDSTARYREGTIVLLAGDSYLVASAEEKSGKTEVTLLQPARRQYTYGVDTMQRSVRPVFKTAPKSANTSTSPVLPLRFSEFLDSVAIVRTVGGQPGQVLSRTEYEVDPSGLVKLTTPLQTNEEVSIWYTGARIIGPGSLRCSYTCVIVPTVENGLAGQVLTASYTTLSPDSFYFRVETVTNYRGELAQQYKAEITSTIPSSGPRTDNMASSKLHTQGRPSLYFDEGKYANEDSVARRVLLYYHTQVNYLEDLLERMDGRRVGSTDGRFKFDGTSGTRVSSFSAASNQIDDTFKASPFPIDFTPPLLPLKFKSSYIRAYEPSPDSRFFPTRRLRTTLTVTGEDNSAKTGDFVADLGQKSLTSITTIERLPPRARVTTVSQPGATTLQVDTTQFVGEPPLRPAFVPTMEVVIQREDGTFVVNELAPAEVASTTATSITFSAPIASSVPLGATVYASPLDTVYRKRYVHNRDLTADFDKGTLHYVVPYPPLDGTVPAIPDELLIQTPNSSEVLAVDFTFLNPSTAPEKFPALYGGTTDDDGNEGLPTVTPSYLREYGTPSLTSQESGGVASLQSLTTSPYEGTGNLSGGGTVITNSIPFPSPVPVPGDLVRILTGVNAGSTFRRVTSVGASTVTVAVPFAADTGFTFQVTVSPTAATGSASTLGVTLTDIGANFTGSGVVEGYTVVALSGPSQYQRRQVVSVTPTTLTLDSPFPTNLVGDSYRVVKSLNTYSNLTTLGSNSSDLYDILIGNPDSEVGSIDSFFAGAFTDLLSPTLAAGNASTTTLQGVGVNFVGSGVRAGDYVYVTPTQTNDGIYTVTEVTSATTLEVAQPFSTPSSVNFRVVRPFGVGESTLLSLYSLRESTVEYAMGTQTWDQLITTAVPVEVSPGVFDSAYFARGFLATTLADRANSTANRLSALPGLIQEVEGVLKGGDRLYDRRYTWIDTRINLEKGIFVQQGRAVQNRIKATQDVLNQLIKLLAVEE